MSDTFIDSKYTHPVMNMWVRTRMCIGAQT